MPAFGGETIRPRCPRPIGAMRLISRPMRLCGVVSRSSISFGKIGRELLEVGRRLASLRVDAVDGFDAQQAVVLLVVFGRPHLPVTMSPVRRPKRRICDCET